MSDNSLQEIINDWSSHVFGLARMYGLELDYSENNVEKVEQLCEIIHQQIASNPNTKEENVDKVSKMIGSYLGELLVKHIGGEWKVNDSKVMTIRLNNFECYPIGKVFKRLKNGREDNIVSYYKICKSQIKECDKFS